MTITARRWRSSIGEQDGCGPGVGALVEWYPRDSLLVWLVLVVDGRFLPQSNPAGFGLPLRYFDLLDVEAVTGQPSGVGQQDLYSASEPAARALADSLRVCGISVLRGDLALIPALEQWIRDRVRQSRWPGGV